MEHFDTRGTKGTAFRRETPNSSGRIIDWVMAEDGPWVNKVMVLTGYACWLERYAPGEAQLRKAQKAAREAERGL